MQTAQRNDPVQVGLSMLAFKYRAGMYGDVDTILIKREIERILEVKDNQCKRKSLCQQQ